MNQPHCHCCNQKICNVYYGMFKANYYHNGTEEIAEHEYIYFCSSCFEDAVAGKEYVKALYESKYHCRQKA